MLNWFVLSLVSAIGFGIIPLFIKSLQQSLSPQVVMASKITVPSLKNSMLIMVVSIIAAIADLSIFYAYKLVLNAGYPRSVQAFSIIIATILSVIVYKQFPSTTGVVGVIFIFIGVVLLSGVR